MSADQQEVQEQVKEVQRVQATLEQSSGSNAQRQARFEEIQEELSGSGCSVRQQMAVVMASFLVGLFAGGDAAELPQDN